MSEVKTGARPQRSREDLRSLTEDAEQERLVVVPGETTGGAGAPEDEEPEDVFATLFPAPTLTIEGPGGKKITLTVRPLSIEDLGEFKDQAIAVAAKLAATGAISTGEDAGGAGGDAQKVTMDLDALPAIMSMIADEFLGVVHRFVSGADIRSKHCPHWVLPMVLQKWLDASFGEDGAGVRPWTELADKTIEMVTGSSPQITETLFSSSSRTGTRGPRSGATPPGRSGSGSDASSEVPASPTPAPRS